MAQAQGRGTVEDFMRIASDLIQQAAEYSGRGEYDEGIDSAIRQIRTMTTALNAALMSVQVTRSPTLGRPPVPTSSG